MNSDNVELCCDTGSGQILASVSGLDSQFQISFASLDTMHKTEWLCREAQKMSENGSPVQKQRIKFVLSLYPNTAQPCLNLCSN